MLTIRQVLHRSPLLLILFAAVAAMAALCFSTIAEFYDLEAVQPDFLSDQSLIFTVNQWSDVTTSVTERELITFVTDQHLPVIVFRNYPVSSGKSVFLHGTTGFKPDLTAGRNFTTEDFAHKQPVALVAEEIQDRCVSRQGSLYLVHDQMEYLVIGVFARDASRVHGRWGDTAGALYFVNMTADPGSPLSGSYLLDAGASSMALFQQFAALATAINPNIRIQAQLMAAPPGQNLLRAIQSSGMLLMAFALTALLVLLNVFSTTNYWVAGRYQELAIRMMSGGRLALLRRMMLRDYLLLVSIGYGLGLIVSILVIRSGILPFISHSIHITAVIASYVVCLAVGATAGWIALSVRLRQNIVRQMRG